MVFETLIQTETHNQVSNTDSMSIHSCILSISIYTDNLPDVTIATEDKIFYIIDTKSVQAFVLKWCNLIEENIT